MGMLDLIEAHLIWMSDQVENLNKKIEMKESEPLPEDPIENLPDLFLESEYVDDVVKFCDLYDLLKIEIDVCEFLLKSDLFILGSEISIPKEINLDDLQVDIRLITDDQNPTENFTNISQMFHSIFFSVSQRAAPTPPNTPASPRP